MARYSKLYSNYIKQKKHQNVTDGVIFERNWVTFGNIHKLEPGKKPFFGDSNFIFTDNNMPVYEKKRDYGKWVARFVYDDVKDAISDVNEVKVNTNSNDLRSYAYYGSMVDLIRATIEDIIMNFPARLYSIEENLYLIDADNEWVDTHKNKISNQFMINLHSEGVMLENHENELRYMSLSWRYYNIVKYDGDNRISEEPILSYEIIQPDIEIYNAYKYHDQGYNFIVYQNHLLQWNNGTNRYVEKEYVTECRNYFENCGEFLRYNGVFYRWDSTDGEYVKLYYYEICNDNYQKIATIRIATEGNTYYIDAYRINGIVYYACNYINFYIEPQRDLIESYFSNLRGLARKLLNRNSVPLYTAKLLTPYEMPSGYYMLTNRSYIWPSNGYCIDIDSPSYNMYFNSLMDTAEKYDKAYSDCIWRCMTHETIKNFDWTYRREYAENDALENIEGGQRMEELLHFYGYIYDIVKRYVDGIKMTNKISYDGYDNCADAEISDKNHDKGWDIVSTIWEPCYFEPYDCSKTITGIDYNFDITCYVGYEVEYDDCLTVFNDKDYVCIQQIMEGDGNEYDFKPMGENIPILWNANCANDIIFGWVATPNGKISVTHYRVIYLGVEPTLVVEGDVTADSFTLDMSDDELFPNGEYQVIVTFSDFSQQEYSIFKHESQKTCRLCSEIWENMMQICGDKKKKTLPLTIQNNCNDKYFDYNNKVWSDTEVINDFKFGGDCFPITSIMPPMCNCNEITFNIGCEIFTLDCVGTKTFEYDKVCETATFSNVNNNTARIDWEVKDEMGITPPQTATLRSGNETIGTLTVTSTYDNVDTYYCSIILSTETLTENEYIIDVQYSMNKIQYFLLSKIGPLKTIVRRVATSGDKCEAKNVLRHQYNEETNELTMWWGREVADQSVVLLYIWSEDGDIVYDADITTDRAVLNMTDYPDESYYATIELNGNQFAACYTITKDNYTHVIPDYCITDGGMTFTPYPCLPPEANKVDGQYISVGCGEDAQYYEKKCNDPSQEMLTYEFFENTCSEKTYAYIIENGKCVSSEEGDEDIILVPNCNGVTGSGFEIKAIQQSWGSGIGMNYTYDCSTGIVTFSFILKSDKDPMPISYVVSNKTQPDIMEGTVDTNPVTIDFSSLDNGIYTIRFCGDDKCVFYVDYQLWKYEETCKGCQEYWEEVRKNCGESKRIPYVIQDVDNPSRFYDVYNEEWVEEERIFDFWNEGNGITLYKGKLFSDGCTKNVVAKLYCDGCFELVNCTAIGIDNPEEIKDICKKFEFNVNVKGDLLIIQWQSKEKCTHYVVKDANDEVVIEEYGIFSRPLEINLDILTENGYTIEMEFDRLSWTMAIDIEKCFTNETYISRIETTHETTPMVIKQVPWINYSRRSTEHLAYVELSGNPSCDLGEGEWDDANTFETLPYVISEASPRFIRVVNNYTTRYYMLSDAGIDHTAYTHGKWYSTINPNSVTPLSCDIDYQRRLNISTNRIFKTKGTKHAIDMVMGLFGYGRNDKSEFNYNSDYSLTEFTLFSSVKDYDAQFYFYELLDEAPADHEYTPSETYTALPTWVDEWSQEYIRVGQDDIYTYFKLNSEYTVGEAIRQLYLHRTSEKMYDDWYTGVPLGDLYDGNKHLVIPYYDKKRTYEGYLYFQQKGGWATIDNMYSEDYNFTFMETVPYLHVLPTVEDLLSVLSIDLRADDIYYVADLSDYVNFDEDAPYNLSHFFKINDKYNPQRFSSWLNVPMTGEIVYNKNYNVDGVTHADYVHAKYLADIIPSVLYNNPHVGYGDYDLGMDYIKYMEQPYKYSIDNYYFDDMKYNYMAQQFRFDTETTPFTDGLCCYQQVENPGIDDIPVYDHVPYMTEMSWNLPEYIKIYSHSHQEYRYYKRFEFDKIDNGLLTPSEAVGLNNKIIVLKNLNDNVYHKQFMKDVVLKYVMQVIPSTAILVLEGFESNTDCCLTYFNLNVVASDSEYGNVYGSGKYLNTTYAVLVAEENEGYHFVRWEKETEDGNVVVSENSTTQVMVCGNDTYVAVFEEDCIITAGCKTTCKMTFECETQETCSTVFLCETESQCDINFTCSTEDESMST